MFMRPLRCLTGSGSELTLDCSNLDRNLREGSSLGALETFLRCSRLKQIRRCLGHPRIAPCHRRFPRRFCHPPPVKPGSRDRPVLHVSMWEPDFAQVPPGLTFPLHSSTGLDMVSCL
ncbi:unnamed protein product [Pleuronectes platessa]|uniref:Uncharacterized protein n=1 Tax=Pleuronectes platessa TaxID=8262 RepID=A0A9N7Z986_PLEPL|nr:unnamed protein product [Pleuronectes platessa]